MGRKGKAKNNAKEHRIRQVVEQRFARGMGSCDWIKQHKMQSRVMKVEQAYTASPARISPQVYAQQQPFFISANGFTLYNAANVLVGEKLPQESLVDLTFKAFIYYEVMDVSIEYIPNRIQITSDGSDNFFNVFQQPTLANNIPQLDFVAPGMAPTATGTSIDENLLSMTARKGCKIVQGTDKVSLHMKLPSNLLQRQSQPMLRTNFSASGRDLYNNADLNNLVILPFISSVTGRTPYGIIRTSMTLRFAGRQNPDAPNMLEADLVHTQEKRNAIAPHLPAARSVQQTQANGTVENQPEQINTGHSTYRSVPQQPTASQIAQFIYQTFPTGQDCHPDSATGNAKGEPQQ